MEKHDVIIVGGGPVGVALAVDLGLRGVSCALVEQYEEPQRIPKGQNLRARTLEHFFFWGIEPEMRAARIMPRGYPIGTIIAYESLAGDFWYAAEPMRGAKEFFFVANERLPQYETEYVLCTKMATLPFRLGNQG